VQKLQKIVNNQLFWSSFYKKFCKITNASGNILIKKKLIICIHIITIIGVKSIGQKVVGNFDFILSYIGLVIHCMNLIFKFNHNSVNHDNIISIKIKYFIKVRKTMILSIKKSISMCESN